MKWGLLTARERVRAGTRAILVLGFAAAVVIYLTAQPPPANPLGYDPLDTKKYLGSTASGTASNWPTP